MSKHKRAELVRVLQTITGSDFYALENLSSAYTRHYPMDKKGIDLLNLVVFSPGPLDDKTIDELIHHLAKFTHKKF